MSAFAKQVEIDLTDDQTKCLQYIQHTTHVSVLLENGMVEIDLTDD